MDLPHAPAPVAHLQAVAEHAAPITFPNYSVESPDIVLSASPNIDSWPGNYVPLYLLAPMARLSYKPGATPQELRTHTNQRCGRSCPCGNDAAANFLPGGHARRAEEKILEMDQGPRPRLSPLLLATRLWRVFGEPKPARCPPSHTWLRKNTASFCAKTSCV